ncbi:hypothetical protein CTZ28_09225 [Streptomyces shenzhenensis]|uniref:Uncharacterized protein n=1 Tax=Streptomyces shenzhenensis TaxID=943815 RepID=A0A3M0IWA9_9ACTN|nr:hypothetical protein CTZ28_09225 [Streptomyces shenzhenensis]
MERASRDPVLLAEPATSAPPAPAPGCDVCEALKRQWGQATEIGSPAHDPSHATDLAVEIGRHPHDWKKGGRA